MSTTRKRTKTTELSEEKVERKTTSGERKMGSVNIKFTHESMQKTTIVNQVTESIEVPIVMSFSKSYDCNEFFTLDTPSDLSLLNFITQKMDRDNMVLCNMDLYENYRDTQKVNGKELSKGTFDNGISALKKKDFLVKTSFCKRKGEYMVNPRFIVKCDEQKRKELITRMMQDKINKKYIDEGYRDEVVLLEVK